MTQVSGVSVVIPSLDEGAELGRTVAAVRAALAGRPHEVIVVDDGSRDGSSAGLEGPDVRVVRHERPMGYGYSLKEGIRLAREERVAIIDADGTYRAEDLARLVDGAGELDMVVGVRAPGPGLGGVARRAGRRVVFALARWVAGTPIPDLNSGLRVLRREAVLRHEPLLPAGFSFTTTLTLALLADGRPVGYVPVEYRARAGRSKVRPLRDTLRFAGLILRTGCLIRPLRVFLPVSGGLLVAAAIRLAYDVFVLRDVGDSAILLLTSGLQIVLMGLLAEMILRRR